MMKRVWLVAVCVLWVAAASARGQWDPVNGDWLRTEATDLRVMTWNVQDSLCSSNSKVEGFNSWTAVAMIVASMQPDVLILQECGDNEGNGTGSGVDSIATMTTVMDLFVHGGADPFRGGSVTAYVQRYAPEGYDLPYVYVGGDDGFNRNVTLSRYPFADLNGSGSATYSSFLLLGPTGSGYWTSGGPEIRGWLLTEIDLPDEVYAGDVVVGNSHLKSGGASSDLAQRLRVSQRIAYVIDAYFNGLGTGVPDPDNKELTMGAPASILDEFTPVIWGGDLNEDENTNGRKGPAEWTTRAALTGGTDGTDRDRSDCVFDDARDPFTNSRATQGSGKLDYLAWQDSIATLRRAFIFNTSTVAGNGGQLPPEVAGFPVLPSGASGMASDHRPVIADLVVELADVTECVPDWDGNGVVNANDVGAFLSDYLLDIANGTTVTDVDGNGVVNANDVGTYLNLYFLLPPECK